MMKQERVRRLLVRAERARKHLMQPHFTRIGLTFGQGHARILDVLLARDHITQKELSDLCHMDVTTMSRSLDRLEESGYLVREKDPGCRRKAPVQYLHWTGIRPSCPENMAGSGK